jgi:hypothetical protein
MKKNHMKSNRSYRMAAFLMPVFLVAFILVSSGLGGQAIASDDYTEPADP